MKTLLTFFVALFIVSRCHKSVEFFYIILFSFNASVPALNECPDSSKNSTSWCNLKTLWFSFVLPS